MASVFLVIQPNNLSSLPLSSPPYEYLSFIFYFFLFSQAQTLTRRSSFLPLPPLFVITPIYTFFFLPQATPLTPPTSAGLVVNVRSSMCSPHPPLRVLYMPPPPPSVFGPHVKSLTPICLCQWIFKFGTLFLLAFENPQI